MMMTVSRRCYQGSWSLILLLLAIQEAHGSGGIPGTTQTISGYDTEVGRDAICWKSQRAMDGIPMPNPLLKDYIVSLSGITLLQACPAGNNITGSPPDEMMLQGGRLRTGQEYTFHVTVDINMTSLNATAGFISDRGPGLLAVQILNCVAGRSGFCSPFIHEEANFRLAEAAKAVEAANPNVKPKPKKRGALHGGSHVHSGYVDVYLDPAAGPVYSQVHVDVPMVVLDPGEYFTMATAQFYFFDAPGEGQEPELFRWDVGNALDWRLISYQEPAEVLKVPETIVLISYGLIAVSAMVLLFLLMEVIKHRNNQVIKLGQGNFLVAFLLSGLVATCTSFMNEPHNDFYCRAFTPSCMISLQIFYAVTIGRLWRIHTLINPLLLKTLTQDTRWTRFMHNVQCTLDKALNRRGGGATRRIRGSVSDGQLILLVCVLVAPQVVLQVLSLLLQPMSHMVDFNEDESTGRAVCKPAEDFPLIQSLAHYGYLVFILLVVGLLGMAFRSRKLPSLLSESKTIFDTTTTSIIIMVMGVAVILVTQMPTSSPAAAYLACIFIILSSTINTSLRIVLPKLRMVWAGETVIVSKLVMDHSKSVRQSQEMMANAGGSNKAILYDMDSLARSTIGPARNADSEEDAKDEPATEEQAPPKKQKSVLWAVADDYEKDQEGKQKKKKREIVIGSGRAPSQKLLLKMVDMQEHLNRMTERIMSGRTVTHDDWEYTRTLAGAFGNVFEREVTFSWEAAAAAQMEDGTGSSVEEMLPLQQQEDLLSAQRRRMPSTPDRHNENHHPMIPTIRSMSVEPAGPNSLIVPDESTTTASSAADLLTLQPTVSTTSVGPPSGDFTGSSELTTRPPPRRRMPVHTPPIDLEDSCFDSRPPSGFEESTREDSFRGGANSGSFRGGTQLNL